MNVNDSKKVIEPYRLKNSDVVASFHYWNMQMRLLDFCQKKLCNKSLKVINCYYFCQVLTKK